MNNDSLFQFVILQASGGGSKSLNITRHSDQKDCVCNMSLELPIYILARDKLKVAIVEIWEIFKYSQFMLHI